MYMSAFAGHSGSWPGGMITLGIVRISYFFSMIRLFHCFPTNRITHRSLSTGLISHTIHIESLPEGYNVNRVLAAVKVNPAESITVAKDHLLVRFFNEDMAKDCVASGSGTSGAAIKIDNTLSPPLSAVDVAALGRLGMSRSLAMSEIPSNVQEKDIQEILSQHGNLESWIFDSLKRTATAHYFDMHNAFQARFTASNQFFALVDLRTNNIKTLPLTNPEGYIFPKWFPAEEADKGMVNCHVKFSRITDPKMILHLHSWTAMLQFASSDLAQRFCNMCALQALELGVEVSMACHRLPIQRSLVTALALGVGRTVTVNLAGKKDLTNSNDYLHFFKQIGVITPESKQQFASPILAVMLELFSPSGVMRSIKACIDTFVERDLDRNLEEGQVSWSKIS
ncbi:hypothetical protein EDD18DRAFT_1116683 [Armillaria luteobubalina]|uniref:Uncharacterized protein n=1 Tax=Armillaria luteobubalina TaxID=153913 RepID=A0AA39NZC2_9AGAR|nr:hypothetical protein EDD18DRAFT_1116683 [Armillaria luteobubalina]